MNPKTDLQQIWNELENGSVMRASLFNLVVVSEESARSPYLKQITHKVLERFPCRIIFISLTPHLKEIQMTASITTGVGGTPCDLIEIKTPELQIDKIPFLILPHFVSDLPIYLLWAEDPSKHPTLLNQLQKWATRFIYDSETSDNLALFANRLLTQQKNLNQPVADLNWARTESWRELLAATFYSPARLNSLSQAKTIQIHYNTFETEFFCHTKIQALYLQAWLATRFNWKLSHATSHEWNYDVCKISLHPIKDEKLPSGTVQSMEVICRDKTHFSFRRDPIHPYQICTTICDEEKCDIPSRYVFSKSQTGLSLVSEIYHPAPSSHFPQVLKFLSSQTSACAG